LLELSYKGQLLQSQLVGSYNADNIAAAIGMGIYFKVPFTKIKAAIEGYVPKNNRSELLKKGSNFIILDAYNANPSSMKSALENFQKLNTSKQKVLILGGMLELGSYSKKAHQELIDQANQITNKLYLVGKEFKELSRTSFENTKALQQHLKQHPLTDSYVLIKGSRGIALEQLLEDIN
jgi:UDP-N-acetylmuramoyl-tripeptide--D-alanyl-D-alanine ligase